MKKLPLWRRPFGAKKILEIGGGHAPYAGVTHAVDKYPDDDAQRAGKMVLGQGIEFREGDLESIPFPGQRVFDFLYTSHVLEHTLAPARAIAEINRVADRGYIETPSPLREQVSCPYPFDGKNDFHFLFCWVPARENAVCVIRKNEKTLGEFCGCGNGKTARRLFELRHRENVDVEPLLPRAAKTTALHFRGPIAFHEYASFAEACAAGRCGYPNAQIVRFWASPPFAWFRDRTRRLRAVLSGV